MKVSIASEGRTVEVETTDGTLYEAAAVAKALWVDTAPAPGRPMGFGTVAGSVEKSNGYHGPGWQSMEVQ